MSIKDDVKEMIRLFWMRIDGEITQEEMEQRIAEMCDKQPSLFEWRANVKA